jgi:hypothetical protein
LQASHYADYTKMKLELANLRKKNEVRARQANKKSSKSMARQTKDILNKEGGSAL